MASDTSLGRTTITFRYEAARMDAETLLDIHKRNMDRPAVYREHRDAFADHLSGATVDAMPEADASTFAWRQWLEGRKGAITRQLSETPTDDAAEGEA